MKATININYSENEAVKTEVIIKENGVVDINVSCYNPNAPRQLEMILMRVSDAVYDEFNAESGEYFWRFTYNRNEIKLIENNEINPSLNFATGEREKGLSVATHRGYAAMGYKYGYKITGNVIAYGSDGEPVLDIKSLKAVSRMMPVAKIEAEKIENRAKNLSKKGWTIEQYMAVYGCHTNRSEVIINIKEYAK